MKTFLALLISCLTLTAATTYPVLTDSTNRLFPGGVTNVFFLNSNVVTTGTMRATGALTLTNSGNVFAGDGSGLTGINGGVQTLNGSATNLSVYSSGTTAKPLQIIGGVQTNSNPVTISATYNAAGVSFDGLKIDITNTAAASGSRGFDYSVGGSSYFKLRSDAKQIVFDNALALDFASSYLLLNGIFLASGAISGDQIIGNYFDVGNSSDTYLKRESAGRAVISTLSTSTLRDLGVRSLFATNLYATNLIVNGGATVTKILSATATLNFDLTALTVEDLTITVTGAADGDVVTLGVPNGSITTSVQYTAWVSAADTVTVRARTSATGENPASGTFRATVIKH